jgi:hypothetical protein
LRRGEWELNMKNINKNYNVNPSLITDALSVSIKIHNSKLPEVNKFHEFYIKKCSESGLSHAIKVSKLAKEYLKALGYDSIYDVKECNGVKYPILKVRKMSLSENLNDIEIDKWSYKFRRYMLLSSYILSIILGGLIIKLFIF